jgi:hypothetical protein
MKTPVGSVNSFMTSTLILPVRASDDNDEGSFSGLIQYKFSLEIECHTFQTDKHNSESSYTAEK